MIHLPLKSAGMAMLCVLMVASCGGFKNTKVRESAFEVESGPNATHGGVDDGSSLLDLFKGDGAASVKVNRFLWTASLDVLDFLPVQSADPFTGVITTGYGRPPGGGRAYRATILISDPALDARSLNVALQTQGGGSVSAATQRAVEDAILARARQLRVNAKKF